MARHDTTRQESARHDTIRHDEPTAGTTNADRRDGAPTLTIREYQGTGIIWSAVGLLAAIALFVVIAFQNTHDVAFEFLWLDVTAPLSLILATAFGLALVLGEAIGFVWRRRRRTRLRERAELRRLRDRST